MKRRVVVDVVEPPPSSKADAPRPDVPPPPKVEPRDEKSVLEEIESIEETLANAEPELALMAPELQRMHLFLWLARARAAADAAAFSDPIFRRVGRLAVSLRRLAKEWWPGTVNALKLEMEPQRSLRGLTSGQELADVKPRNWAEAADVVEKLLAERMSRAGFEDGWADVRSVIVEPDVADALVARAQGEVDAAFASKQPFDAIVSGLVDSARRLRKARRGLSDGRAWAKVVGQLRERASNEPGKSAPLSRALDPRTVPVESWDRELRHERRPGVEHDLRVARTSKELADALVAAFDVLDTPELGVLVSERVEEIEKIPDAMLPDDRRTRRRLAQLKRLLGMSAESSDVVLRVEEEPEAPPPGPSPLRLAIREKVAGKKVLFVSNREDPELKQALELVFGFDLTWGVAEPRRVDALKEKIGRRAFDLVLSATGFQDHATDWALGRAAKMAEVPYVRVNRGRVAACERALARELGVLPDAAGGAGGTVRNNGA